MKVVFDRAVQKPPKSKLRGAFAVMCFSKIKFLSVILFSSLFTISAVAEQYENPILQSIADGDISRFDALMRRRSAEFAVDASDKNGVRPLHLAAERGDLHMVNAILEKKASVDRLTHEGATTIALAIKNKHYDVARVLLEKRPAVFSSSNNGQTALHLLAQQMLEQPKPFESDAAKLFLQLVAAGADHGDSYRDPKNEKDVMPLTLISEKISTKNPDYIKFADSVETARKQERAFLGFSDEPADSPTTPAKPTQKPSTKKHDD
jgi:Ankyrin repeats (3 copies)